MRNAIRGLACPLRLGSPSSAQGRDLTPTPGSESPGAAAPPKSQRRICAWGRAAEPGVRRCARLDVPRADGWKRRGPPPPTPGLAALRPATSPPCPAPRWAARAQASSQLRCGRPRPPRAQKRLVALSSLGGTLHSRNPERGKGGEDPAARDYPPARSISVAGQDRGCRLPPLPLGG